MRFYLLCRCCLTLVWVSTASLILYLLYNTATLYRELGYRQMRWSTEAPVTLSDNPVQKEFLMANEGLCKSDEHIRYVVYAYSKVDNLSWRKAFRAAWAQPNLFTGWPSRLLFIIGNTEDEQIRRQLISEQKEFGDLLQTSFKDTYMNLTYKGIAALKWLSTFCKDVDYLIKTDDDIYVNIFKIRHKVEEVGETTGRFMMGHVRNHSRILRKGSNDVDCGKWRVDASVFPGRRFYPVYCQGCMYAFPGSMAVEMYEASQKTPFFFLEDVFFTSMVVENLGGPVKHINAGWCRVGYYNFHKQFVPGHKTPQVEAFAGDYKSQETFLNAWALHLRALSDEEKGWVEKVKLQRLLKESEHMLLAGV